MFRSDTKVWWKSKTLWINAIVGALVALQAVSGALQPVVSAHFYALVAVGLPIINAVLRVITTQGLVLKDDPPSTES